MALDDTIADFCWPVSAKQQNAPSWCVGRTEEVRPTTHIRLFKGACRNGGL